MILLLVIEAGMSADYMGVLGVNILIAVLMSIVMYILTPKEK